MNRKRKIAVSIFFWAMLIILLTVTATVYGQPDTSVATGASPEELGRLTKMLAGLLAGGALTFVLGVLNKVPILKYLVTGPAAPYSLATICFLVVGLGAKVMGIHTTGDQLETIVWSQAGSNSLFHFLKWINTAKGALPFLGTLFGWKSKPK